MYLSGQTQAWLQAWALMSFFLGNVPSDLFELIVRVFMNL